MGDEKAGVIAMVKADYEYPGLFCFQCNRSRLGQRPGIGIDYDYDNELEHEHEVLALTLGLLKVTGDIHD